MSRACCFGCVSQANYLQNGLLFSVIVCAADKNCDCDFFFCARSAWMNHKPVPMNPIGNFVFSFLSSFCSTADWDWNLFEWESNGALFTQRWDVDDFPIKRERKKKRNGKIQTENRALFFSLVWDAILCESNAFKRSHQRTEQRTDRKWIQSLRVRRIFAHSLDVLLLNFDCGCGFYNIVKYQLVK